MSCNCACMRCLAGYCCMAPTPSWVQPPPTTAGTFTLPSLAVARERVEIRRNPDGTIDEVLLYVGDRCVFHLEQNSKHSWFFGLYPEGEEIEQFWVYAKGRVTVRSGRDMQVPS